MNTAWTLSDYASGCSAKVPQGSWVAFGSHESNDVVLREARVPPFALQVLVEDGFLFFDNVRQSWSLVGVGNASVGGARFQFEAGECDWTALARDVPEDEVNAIFHHPLLEETLQAIRNGVGERHVLNSDQAPEIPTVSEISAELGSRFWRQYHIADPGSRLLFRRILWALRSHVEGPGPLARLLSDPEITEIMVCGPRDVYVEIGGVLRRTSLIFESESEVRALVERLVSRAGRRIDESRPVCDFRWIDGSRLHAAIPPVAVKGSSLTIRRFPERALSASDLLLSGSISPAHLCFLQQSVSERKNIIVSGGTGTGKTTLLNILCGFVLECERIITIEDTAELRLDHNHVVSMEARPANSEGCGEISLRELLRNALRMRPDRVIVGECRGPEALDMLQAMNTGHDGSLSTVHANSAIDALRRLETLVLMAGTEMPLSVVREQMASAVDVVVQLERRDGKRVIASVHRVSCLSDGCYVLEEI
jgi:Flp pilus assembly CpaF family ATPase